MEDNFKLVHDKGRLFAIIVINKEIYEMDVTNYFEKENAHDEWLDYRLELN